MANVNIAEERARARERTLKRVESLRGSHCDFDGGMCYAFVRQASEHSNPYLCVRMLQGDKVVQSEFIELSNKVACTVRRCEEKMWLGTVSIAWASGAAAAAAVDAVTVAMDNALVK